MFQCSGDSELEENESVGEEDGRDASLSAITNAAGVPYDFPSAAGVDECLEKIAWNRD